MIVPANYFNLRMIRCKLVCLQQRKSADQ